MRDNDLIIPTNDPYEQQQRDAAWSVAVGNTGGMSDAECDLLAKNSSRTRRNRRWNFLVMTGENPRSVCQRWYWLQFWSAHRSSRHGSRSCGSCGQ